MYAHAQALRPRRAREALAVPCSSMLPSTRPPASALWTHSFRGALPRLRAPLPTSRLSPHGDLRTARGRGGSLHLPWNGLTPYAPYRSPGKSGRSVAETYGARPCYPSPHRAMWQPPRGCGVQGRSGAAFLLREKAGCPSTHPPQPPGDWTPPAGRGMLGHRVSRTVTSCIMRRCSARHWRGIGVTQDRSHTR
jgi:hypothetical protein